MVYMLTFTINIPQMLAYIPAPWILWVMMMSMAYGSLPLANQTRLENPNKNEVKFTADILQLYNP